VPPAFCRVSQLAKSNCPELVDIELSAAAVGPLRTEEPLPWAGRLGQRRGKFASAEAGTTKRPALVNALAGGPDVQPAQIASPHRRRQRL